MAYTSDIDLKISESPKTTDPALFPDMVDIYNALHILAQWVDQVVKQAGQGSGDEATPPWEAITFDKWFYAPAAVAITKGSIVTPFYSKRVKANFSAPVQTVDGIILGAAVKYQEDGYGLPGGTDFIRFNKGTNCIAMNDAEVGDLVQCGIGPGILQVPGIKMGQPVSARNSITTGFGFAGNDWQQLEGDGKLYIIPSNAAGIDFSLYTPVGIGVANDAALMFPNGYMDKQNYLPSLQTTV